VIIGPSGCGKSTLVRRLIEQGLIRTHPTWTTRPPRDDEDPADEQLEHRFVDDDRFTALDDDGFFLGTAQLFGLPHRYGLPRLEMRPDGPVDAVVLRAPLVDELRSLVPELLVYQVESDLDLAARRIEERSVDDDEVRARTASNGHELDQGRRIADRVFTNDGDIDDLEAAIVAALHEDYQASLGQARRGRSTAEKIAIAVGAVAAVLIGGVIVTGLLFAYALSEWANNK
jgi:guanylate kinase